jgi:hypothetical protein
LATELKDQDYDFLEILDENEEIENHYEELANEFQKNEHILAQQRQIIEQSN